MTQQTEQPKTLDDISEQLTELSREVEQFNQKFANYQQATQWVVQLAFSLIASVTVITIISSIFKK